MPSPVGHSLIGLALGWGVYLRPGRWRDLGRRAREAAPSALAGIFFANAPDLDYLPGIMSGDLNAFHHGYTHSLGWITLVAGGCWLVGRSFRLKLGAREFAFIFAALASHLLADWITDDGRLPYGIPAAWPFTDRYFQCPWVIFPRLMKKDFSEFLQWANVRAALIEAAWCLPLVLLVAARKSAGGKPARADLPPATETL